MNLLVINDYGLQGGGTENRVRLLIDQFLKMGCFRSIHILQLGDRKAPSYDNRVKFYYSSGNYKETYNLTQDIIKKQRIDITQAHNLLAITPSCLAAAKALNIPLVWFAHDYWPLCAKRSFIDPYRASEKKECQKANFLKCIKCSGIKTQIRLSIFRRILEKADLAVASCNFVKQMYESHGLLKGRWKVITPWIKTDRFMSKDKFEKDRSIIFTGSLLDYKGAWVLAQAFIKVVKVFPQVRLKFAGSEQELNSRYRNRIDDIFAKSGATNQVEFLGYLDWDKLVQLYNSAGVYVCPTVCMESFGLNWAEAMAAGCPVVASEIGSLPDFLKGRAVLVPPRDSAGLAEGIIRVLNNKNFSEELSNKGHDYVENNFKVERAAEEILNLYKKHLNAIQK